MSNFRPIRYSDGKYEGDAHFEIDGVRVSGIIDVQTKIGTIRCYVNYTRFVSIGDDNVEVSGKDGQLVSVVNDPAVLKAYLDGKERERKERQRMALRDNIRKLQKKLERI